MKQYFEDFEPHGADQAKCYIFETSPLKELGKSALAYILNIQKIRRHNLFFLQEPIKIAALWAFFFYLLRRAPTFGCNGGAFWVQQWGPMGPDKNVENLFQKFCGNIFEMFCANPFGKFCKNPLRTFCRYPFGKFCGNLIPLRNSFGNSFENPF